jgi:hypothetical protein
MYNIISIDTITVSSTSLFNTVYSNYNIMNRGCKYTSKEIINIIVVDLYYIYYYVWPNVYWKLVFRLPGKKSCKYNSKEIRN